MKPNWTRRRFVGVGPGVAASSLAASRRPSAGPPEREAAPQVDGGKRKLPRLIYYNDAHHFHAKRIDPPVSRFQLQRPVDEVLGTGVGMLVLGLGYGDVYFHDSRVGRVVGQEKQTWEHIIDWRIMCMVRDARKLGTDQLREVIRRGREESLPVLPSLKLQDGNRPGSQRCGWLKWKQGRSVCIGEPDPRHPSFEYCYDFSLNSVREDKLAMVREVLKDYRADGIELDFMFFSAYFKKRDVEKNLPVMNRFVRQVRELADGVGRSRNRAITVSARVFHRKEENLKVGLDVETWLRQGDVDLVVGQVSDQLFEPAVDVGWMVDAAGGRAGVYVRPPLRVYDERTPRPTIEMYRALGQSLRSQGANGLYLGYLRWPLARKEHQILREMAYPETYRRESKRYFLQPAEGAGTFTDPPPGRRLPLALKEGEWAGLTLQVADDLEEAANDGELRKPRLTLRLQNFSVEDEIRIRLNGRLLPWERFEVTDERALRIPVRLRRPIEAPSGFAAHWLRTKLDPELLRQGENRVEILARRLTPTASWTRFVSGVEIRTRYRSFARPEGIEGADRIEPS
ncbi:MAG: hypothetical protein OXT71_22405 [Acidobacteriota bacterium]|nr:hypothetical protein [Acidobacteriota bacterium]